MGHHDQSRVITDEVVVEAGIDAVWKAWTTEEGLKTFFAPASRVDLRVDGSYEILFAPDASAGERGAEGVRILALQPKKMLAFTWNAPPHMPEVRKQWTHVVIRFEEIAGDRTKVSLSHDGWGEGGEWDQAFDYFTRAWKKLVLPRLVYSFAVGPVDWQNPPRTE
jgi:uncharacterized protein YndB with AHSA1/START domain